LSVRGSWEVLIFPGKTLLYASASADKGYMGLRRILLVSLYSGLACAFFLPGLGGRMEAQSIGAAVPPIPLVPRMSVAGPIFAAFFFVLWLLAWRRERGHLDQRQGLQFELLARTEELNRERVDLADARNALRLHAVRDELTGLPNRTSIVEVLDREVARAVRDKSTLSVVLADIDHLGKINETHGQPIGDEVLKEVGRRLEHAIRSYDAAGRYSGGDFLLVLPSFEADTGVERLRKIHDSICGKPMIFPSCSLSVTCSFGVSILLPDQFYSSEELLVRAGQAMATAKQTDATGSAFSLAPTAEPCRTLLSHSQLHWANIRWVESVFCPAQRPFLRFCGLVGQW